ncbi:hypothetical protein GF406_25575 [candidate division KSB1 bacterium]|nr:hypothetical protein [candidate division KSB1 bacterium]
MIQRHCPKATSILATFLVLGCMNFIQSVCYANEPIKILWLGSSSTYVHDMPQQAGHWLAESEHFDTVSTFLTGKSGTGFHEYMRKGFKAQYGLELGRTLVDKISRDRFDYVVIQQITYFMADSDSTEIINDTETLCKTIRQAGGEPVFYEMGWRTEPLNETGRQMILREARKNSVTLYAPCSSAWTRVRQERPDLELFNLPDTDHPGTLGTYLNMCCFYAAFTGKPPQNVSQTIFRWPLFGRFDKDLARKRLETLTLDPYHAAMPGWMQLISSMRWQESIDPEIAEYLQNTAFAVYQEKSSQLK